MSDNENQNLSRRSFIGSSLGAVTSLAVASVVPSLAEAKLHRRSQNLFPESLAPLSMPPLPYADTALAPVISQSTLGFHYGKHTKAYYDNLNKAIAGTELAGQPLEMIIRDSAFTADKIAIYNNASQAMNHSFYFAGLKPNGGGEPPAELLAAIKASFGGMAEFKAAFLAASGGQFGSGWVWLVMESLGSLKIVSTANADSPAVVRGFNRRPAVPLLTVDVWEHAYYLDYQNLRAGYTTAVLEKLINWDFVNANFLRAKELIP